ncbi:MAG: tetratricopeptide repeat protein [Xanthomonadales bacterium]|nr:tetratricopeptide repeat protein [Xanthomonadales bacterium]
MSFFEELKRRNVIRVGIAYLVGAWLVIQVTETLFPVYGLSDGAIRMVVTILAIGFLPALILAWVFERTADGIKLERNVDRSQSETLQTGRTLDRAIIVVLALALGYFLVDKFVLRQATTTALVQAERSPALEDWERREAAEATEADTAIAVLPFTNFSGDPATEPFTLGIHDDLLTHLSRIDALKVTSRTSVLQYRNTTQPIPVIAEELGVDYILEGGIQRAGNRVRINLQLIEAATDRHLWAEIYDRELTAENLFAVQADVAGEVSKSLQTTLLPEEQKALETTPTRSMAAYDLYLLGRHHQQTRTAESLEQSVAYFEQAIEEDPRYVGAYAGLAQSRLLLVGYGNETGSEALPAAREILDQALELDRESAEVWAAEGLYRYETGEIPESIEALERAIELDIQNYHAWLWYGNSLAMARRYEEHLEALEAAYSLEPLSYPVNVNLANAYSLRGDFARARTHLARVDQIDDQNPTQWLENIADTHYAGGELARAVIDAREILAVDPGNTDAMRLMINSYVELDDGNAARRWADEAARLNAFAPSAYWLFLGRKDFEGLIAYLEDKRTLSEATGNEYLFDLFQAAYLGDRIESARAYATTWLENLGGRMEVNPGFVFHWDNLLMADFLMRHGNDLPGGPARGREMLEEVQDVLLGRQTRGFNHPGTWAGISMAYAMAGDTKSSLDALEQAINRGFSSRVRLELLPQWDRVRAEPRFAELQARIDQRLAREAATLADARLADYEPIDGDKRIFLPREVLERYTGYYTDGNVLGRVWLSDDGELLGQPGPQPPSRLIPLTETRFFVDRARQITVEFVLDDEGRVTHVLQGGDGGVSRMKPADPPPEPVELSVDQLARFEGTWEATLVEGIEGELADSDIWTVTISGDSERTLWMDFDNQPRRQLQALSERELFFPWFIHRWELHDGGAAGEERLIMHLDGTELVFTRRMDASS